ncbi:MAG: NH(3)-dependent NAD(+) synthetase [Candidatus Gottesmanbacteria bacterium GW2011_GWB1_49_7]|uniref:NH(3)-dependent NAD(+) synthetase n=1 Tax=Candidatus Gottesmanbacteria bacterium GW2011_GWB1_49_7 TaxID=1618448 RepID=A0A0G1YC78_9BACT|nr:MAG: NH(3)-dependent NAD(+) synthetase [Candidatus Gottesmanbacteria bacterium GW2011_GWB1_49_7]
MDWSKEIARIEQFIQDNAPNGVVIGISGGVDSAVVYELCVRALGANKIIPIHMPYGEINKDAGAITIKHGQPLQITPINQIVDLTDTVRMGQKGVLGNLKARARMLTLYYYANLYNKRVVGTTNRSEWFTGYFTKFGDGACDFEPILHLYKTEIFELAKELCIPQAIIDKAPSADLWEGQTDEGELGMKYEDLDQALKTIKLWTEQEFSQTPWLPSEEIVLKVEKLWVNSTHKREMPPNLLEAE